MKRYNVVSLVWLLLVLAAVAGRAPAQTAPAGNAHPQAQALTADDTATNPFGAPDADAKHALSPAAKHEFAKSLNLEPLRSLAVFHDGRVKVLDTLARETVQRTTGRRAYADADPAAPDKPRALKYDHLFTLLDFIIDPGYYADKPIIGIDYLELRRELLAQQYPDESTQKRELKTGGVSPMLLQHSFTAIAQKHMGVDPWPRALADTDAAWDLFQKSQANLKMVAPASRTEEWRHLSKLPADSPIRQACMALGAAWRSRDAAAANTAIATLGTSLPQVSLTVYPTSRRALELTYNRVNAFEWGYWAYCLSLITLLLAFGTGRRWLAATGSTLLVLAVALHAFGFIARCIIAERFAIQNQFESMTGLSLFAAGVGTTIMLARRQWLFGAAAAAVGFMVLITATQAGIPGEKITREAAILNTSILLKYHVTTVLVSYGLISLGFVCSLFYLGSYYMGRRRTEPTLAATGAGEMAAVAVNDDPATSTRAKLLGDLDTAQMIVLQLAFWTLGVGILLGAWWADHSWGRWWGFDPKEMWALATWIIYLIVIHVRIAAPARKGLTTAWLSTVGFFVMLWTYFGVNLLLPGLHAYA